MMKKTILATVISLSIMLLIVSASCNQKHKAENETTIDSTVNARLEKVFADYWKNVYRFSPLEATFEGNEQYNDRLANDQTQGYRDSLILFTKNYRDTVQAIDRDKLTNKNKLSYDIFLYDRKIDLEGMKFDDWMIPFTQMFGLPTTIATLGSGRGAQPFHTVKDYENWRKRVQEFPAWTDSAIGNFQKGMKAGVVLPKILVKRMIAQLEGLIAPTPEKSVFYGPIRSMPKNFSDTDKKWMTKAYTNMIRNEITPTYQKWVDFLKDDYLPHARTTDGMAGIPNGKAMYKYYVKAATTTDESPEEMYKTGLAQVKKISAEMNRIKDSLGFKGNLQDLFHYMKADPKFFPFKKPQEVLDSFQSIEKTVKSNMHKLYGHFPKAKLEIRQTPTFLQEAYAVPFYRPDAPDGSRPGVLFVPIPDAEKYNATSMDDHFLHEAIPGHHFQLSIQGEDTTLPDFRRFGGDGAYIEGYAFYCESLGKPLGLYRNPYQYLASLQGEIHRAIRLVLDVGIHLKGMTREEAIKYMTDHEPIDKHTATSEVERYMAIPAQALTYGVGRAKIIRMRNRYKKELGDKFSLKDFHDALLKDGSMPLEILQKQMDNWAKKQ